MLEAPIPADEESRLALLKACRIMHTPSEEAFDDIVRLAADLCGTEIALISLIDADRQWFKSNVGLPGISETPRESSFCAHAILGSGLLEVADAQHDPRFADNPLVTGAPDIRFYAGAPITLHDGMRMGTLCVIDREPGALDDRQRRVLKQLARAAGEALELRRYAISEHAAQQHESAALRQQVETARDLQQKLHASEMLLERTGRLAGVGGWELDLRADQLTWSDQTCRVHDVAVGFRPTMQEALDFYEPDARPVSCEFSCLLFVKVNSHERRSNGRDLGGPARWR